MLTARFDVGELSGAWQAELARLADLGVVARLWDGDHTVVAEDPTEVADRLGWLHVLPDSLGHWGAWTDLADEISDEVDHVVLVGMGGSSLFPDLLATTFERADGFPTLEVLDSTHPAAVRRVLDRAADGRTLVVVSSKSGSTVETRSHLDALWDTIGDGGRFVAITDPGSGLEELARSRGFRAVVHGVPEIGGRFSALSAFGMLPAALLGLDGDDLLDAAEEAAAVLGADTPEEHHLGVQLGALMAVAAQAGRDRMTLLVDPRLAAFGDWVEQLVAESTGKHGHGVLPVVGEDETAPGTDGRWYAVLGEVDHGPLDAPAVHLEVEEPADLGAQVFLWEFATAVAGISLGVNPFDQPDVESAKVAARAALAAPAPRRPPRCRWRRRCHSSDRRTRWSWPRSSIRNWRRHSGPHAAGSATGSACRPRSGSARGSSTPPVSCTRAARTASWSCRCSTWACPAALTTWACPAPTTRSANCSSPRPTGTSPRCARAATGPCGWRSRTCSPSASARGPAPRSR